MSAYLEYRQMANSLVIRRDTSLAKRERALRAAQYVRVSTDYQRYSIQNQAAAIAAFALRKSLTIVRTYVDEGRSGLRIRGRLGLIELIDDVGSGRADFGHILVYDVSRWGRFQDVEESAHYEFICKQNGITVAYCAEQFENDGSFLSSIVKNIKRVMAAEYSRELAVKVHAAQLRGAAAGFRQGGPSAYGLCREVVDEDRRSKGYLRRGQQKNLKTDRVLLRAGTPNEIGVIQGIFREYVEERKSQEEIVRRLNREGAPNHLARPWTRWMVDYLLRNENYIGNTVYNRESRPLGGKKIKNPPDLWIRTKGSITPVVGQDVFLRAQKRLTLRWLHLSDDDLLLRLKSLFEAEGRLSEAIINRTLGVPAINVYIDRFGSLRNAYRRIGYEPKWNFDWIDRKSEFSETRRRTAVDVAARLEKLGATARFKQGVDILTVNSRLAISIRIARAWRPVNKKLVWTIYRRVVMPQGYILAIRLGEGNNDVLDYLLLPTDRMKKPSIRFNEAGSRRFDRYRFHTLGWIATAIRRIERRGPKKSEKKQSLH